MKWIDVNNKVKHREYSREVSDKSQCLLRNSNWLYKLFRNMLMYGYD